MNLHERTAAQFEAEGRAAYLTGRNPYKPGTMANTRWAIGWHQAEAIKLEAAPMFKVNDIEGNEWLVTDTHSGPHGTDMPGRAYWVQRLHDSRKALSVVLPGIMGRYLPSLEAVHATLARKA